MTIEETNDLALLILPNYHLKQLKVMLVELLEFILKFIVCIVSLMDHARNNRMNHDLKLFEPEIICNLIQGSL